MDSRYNRSVTIALYLYVKNSSKEEKQLNKRRKDTRWLASVALMMAVVILLANTPLGMIQLPVIKATTVHIPVILGAVLLLSLIHI